MFQVGHGPMSTMQTIINEFIVVADQVDVRYLAVTCTDVNGAEWVFEDSLGKPCHRFSNPAFDWQSAQPPANQMPCRSEFVLEF